MSEWISVEDKLPKPYEDVLVFDTLGEIEVGDYNAANKYWNTHTVGKVLYWMPLPKPPAKTEKAATGWRNSLVPKTH